MQDRRTLKNCGVGFKNYPNGVEVLSGEAGNALNYSWNEIKARR